MKTDSIENKISTFVNDYLANEQKYNDLQEHCQALENVGKTTIQLFLST